MTTLPNMGIVLPALGADIGTWDDKLNAGLALVDAHDHTPGKGVRITPAAISIDALLDFHGNDASNVGVVAFAGIAALATGAYDLYVDTSDGELYYRNASGVNVKLTAGNTVNISLVGGIVGDYSTVGAEVAYDDANDRYTFKQQGAKPWARLASGPVRLYEFNTVETVYTELAPNAALAASYTITLPAALPGAQTAMQLSAAGAVVLSNAFTSAVSSTSTVTATDMRYTTGRPVWLHASAGRPTSITGAATIEFTMYDTCAGWTNQYAYVNGSSSLLFPVTVDENDTITDWSVRINKGSGAGTTWTAGLYSQTTTGALVLIGTTQSSSAAAPGNITFGASGLTTVAASGVKYVIKVTTTTVSGDTVYGADYAHKRP